MEQVSQPSYLHRSHGDTPDSHLVVLSDGGDNFFHLQYGIEPCYVIPAGLFLCLGKGEVERCAPWAREPLEPGSIQRERLLADERQ